MFHFCSGDFAFRDDIASGPNDDRKCSTRARGDEVADKGLGWAMGWFQFEKDFARFDRHGALDATLKVEDVASHRCREAKAIGDNFGRFRVGVKRFCGFEDGDRGFSFSSWRTFWTLWSTCAENEFTVSFGALNVAFADDT